jgi:hypothetical protein
MPQFQPDYTPHTQQSPADEAAASKLITCSLDPLRVKGADALAPDPSLGILRVCLRQLEIRWRTPLNITTVTQGDDLLAVDPELQEVPDGAAITAATFEFRVAGEASPVTAELRPPSTIRLHASAGASRIRNWLAAAGFAISKATTVLVIALAALSAAIPDTDDDPDDDDDQHHAAWGGIHGLGA